MFCCRAFSRTLTCFLLYTLSTRWSVTIIPVVRFTLSSRQPPITFSCVLGSRFVPLWLLCHDVGSWSAAKCGLFRTVPWKFCFTFISRWQRPWRTSEMHLKWTWINLFFSAYFTSYTFFPEKGKLPVYAPPCVEVKTWILISDPYRFYALSVLTVSSVSVYWCSKENMIYAVHCSLLKH